MTLPADTADLPSVAVLGDFSRTYLKVPTYLPYIRYFRKARLSRLLMSGLGRTTLAATPLVS